MENFVTKFHNLDGDLIKERKKSFFKLLKETSYLTQPDIDNAIQNLHPKTYQERLFWIETLVYFKKTTPLLELLKQGNREYVKIIIGQKWFIEDVFKTMTADELVNNFFPSVSCSTRLKLLRRISNCWCEEKADELFDAVQKRYGFFIALSILQTCSIMKIKNILKENEIILSTYQVIYIFNKNEDLFRSYLNHINIVLNRPYDQQNVLNLIALKNPTHFLQLLELNKIMSGKLPKAASEKIVKIAKQEILNDPQTFLKILNTRALVKTLNVDFKTFYKSIFPKKLSEINVNSTCIQLLKYFPKSKRWEFFYETFKTNFSQKTMTELLEILDTYIFKLNPGKDVIRNWAEVHYKATNNEIYLRYFATSVSIPLIKEKINVTSDNTQRETLIKLLITTCSENKDIEALDQVFEYIGTRHKNEDAYIFKNIIEFICETFSNDELTQKHWEFICKQIIFIRTVGTINFFGYRSISEVLLRYTFRNNKDLFKTVATDYIKDVAELSLYFRLYVQDPELEAEIFREFCNLFPSTINTDHKNFQKCQASLVTEFFDICEYRPQECLNMLEIPYLLSTLENVINKTGPFDYYDERMIKSAILYHINFPQYLLPFLNDSKIIELLTLLSSESKEIYGNVVKCIVKKEIISETEQNILLHFLNKMDLKKVGCWIIDDIVEWLFLFRPKFLVPSFERIYSLTLCYVYKNEVKHYSHLGLDKQVCDYLKKHWIKAEPSEQIKAINILQNLLSEDEFIEFVNENFNPKKSLAEIHNDHVTIEIQHYVENILKNGNDALKFLPLVLQFCEGNYLSYALPSLYSLFSRTPGNLVNPYLETLYKNAVPVRKHAIFLSCELFDYNYIFNFLNTADLSPSPIRKHLFLATFKYFKKNSSDELFVLLNKYLEVIDKSDENIFSTLVKVVIQKKYRARYIEICWKIFERIDNKEFKLNKYFEKLLQQIFNEEILKSMSSEFINNIINHYFAVQGKNRLSNIDQFAILCLAYRSNQELNIFTNIFDLLSKLNKQIVNNFCTMLVEFIHDKKLDSNFMSSFIQNWNKYFSITDSIDEHITLNLLLKYSNHSMEDYAQLLVNYMEQLIYELGPAVFDVFKNNFDKLTNKLKMDHYRLYLFMLRYKASAAVCVLVIQLLTPVDNEESEELKTTYRQLTQILSTSAEPIVQSIYTIYLKNHENYL